MAKKTEDDARRVRSLHQAVREVGATARLTAVLLNKLHPSMQGLELLALIERKLGRVDELLAEAEG